MTRKTITNLIPILVLFIACKNYYNDMIDWTDKIEIGTDIGIVKNNQPDFVKITWNKPIKSEGKIFYEITEIKGNNDILDMSNFLVFANNKYQGRQSHK